jgi:DNA-binding response OmpR family regulator
MSTILIIEDDQSTAYLLQVMLEKEGYQVMVAGDGLQGIKLAQAKRPDVTLLDLMLPGLDGFEVCNRLRADATMADMAIFVLSGKRQEADKQMALKLGANLYFAKPYKPEDLLAAIRAALAQKTPAARGGASIAFVGVRSIEASPIAVNVALALVKTGQPVTLADLRPFAIDHALALNLAPPRPVALAQREPGRAFNFLVHPAHDLRVLNNLEGSGEAGQITPVDATSVLEALQPQTGYALIEAALYPVELVRAVAGRCAAVVLVAAANPATLAGVRSALNVLERVGLNKKRMGLVLVGANEPTPPPDLSAAQAGWEPDLFVPVPLGAGLDHPAFRALAEWIRGVNRPAGEL